MPLSKANRIPELIERVNTSPTNEIRLFLVTRHVRPEVARSSRNIFRYEYRPHTVQLTTDLQNFIRAQLVEQLGRAVGATFEEYRVIDDDEPKTIDFDVSEKDFAFLRMLRDQLPRLSEIPPVLDLGRFEGELWAQVFAFPSLDGQSVYAISKISRSKVAIDTTENLPRFSPKRLTAKYNTREQRLETLDAPVISLDLRAAAFYFDNHFYIFNKPQFNQVAGVEEDFAETAVKAIDRVAEAEMVEGLSILREEFTNSKRLTRRLANLSMIEELTRLSPERIAAMREVAGLFGERFVVNSAGKIVLADKADLESFVTLLEDYYVTSLQTGIDYGSRAKKRVRRRGTARAAG